MGVLLSHRMILQSTIYRLLGKYLAAIARALVCVLFGAALGAVVATAVVLVFWSVIDWIVQMFFSTG